MILIPYQKKRLHDDGREYMKLRYYAALVTGALAEIFSCGALWMFTNLQIQEVAFLAVLAFWLGIAAVMLITGYREEGQA